MQLLPARNFNMDTLEHQTLDGGRVIKAPINRGYSKILNLRYTMVAAAGLNSLLSIVVPPNYLWIVENVSVMNGAKAVVTTCYHTLGAVIMFGTPALNSWMIALLSLTMAPGEQLETDWVGCTAGDGLFMWIHGRVVKLS